MRHFSEDTMGNTGQHPRRGLALVLSTMIMLAVVAMVIISSDSLFALSRLQSLDMARQQASMAAEAVAALIEARLNSDAANLMNLKRSLAGAAVMSNYWNLKGYCNGIDESGNGFDDEGGGTTETTAGSVNGGLYIGNCMVRWRLEPVKVYDSTSSDPLSITGKRFIVNSEPDASQLANRDANAAAADTANTLYPANYPQTYHFRIVTEAFYLRNPDQASVARPWSKPADRVCRAQSQRITQLNVINLFRYALFHAAEGPTGDIDFMTGTTLNVTGAVHSNGAIYFSGGDSGGMGPPAWNYHRWASGTGPDTAGTGIQSVIIAGTAGASTTVTGVGGIFRMAKHANLMAVLNGAVSSTYADPWLVPKSGVGPMVGVRNLNSDVPGSTRHTINGRPFHAGSDSRTPFTATGMRTTFSNLLRDRQLGATVVKTLANIPELGGRPFEHQKILSGPLFTLDPGNPNDFTMHTAMNQVGAVRMYYTQDPLTYPGSASFTVTPTPAQLAWPATCNNIPVFYTNAAHTDTDISTSLISSSFSVGDGDAGFNSHEAKGYYLQTALYGRTNATMVPDALTG